jgi:uncharacterized membrane protein YbaN (DUF454 family)
VTDHRRCPVHADRPARPVSLRRWLLAAVGVICVGLGAIGVFVPGLPTTVFLLAAGWFFTRSCPWLEERLIRNRFFAPFHRYLEPGVAMPRRARVVTIAVMWTAIAISALLMIRSRPTPPDALLVALATAGAIGTLVVLRIRRDGLAD